MCDSLQPHGIAAHQASLSFTISQSLLKHMSLEYVMLSHPLLPSSPLAFNLSQVFSIELSLHQMAEALVASVLPMNIQD